MTEQIRTNDEKICKKETIQNAIGFGLAAFGVVTAGSICFGSKMPVAIENPVIPAIASFFILVNYKSKTSLEVIQKITGFYLVAVLVNQLSQQYFQTSSLPINFRVSSSIVVLSLFAAGFFIAAKKSVNPPDSIYKTLFYSWVFAFGVIIAHMAIVGVMLNRFYGYGYDRDLYVLGNLCLYFLLFIFLWKKLGNIRFRQAVGLILAVFYTAVALTGRFS